MEVQTFGRAGFSALIIGKVIRKDVSRGITTGIKTTHGKGLGTKRTTRISARPTRRRIDIIRTNHFRFPRLICKSHLRRRSPATLLLYRRGPVQERDFTGTPRVGRNQVTAGGPQTVYCAAQ
jgi:hypothetical protein